jgi:uncharacterized membrane protein (UPF0127 family)
MPASHFLHELASGRGAGTLIVVRTGRPVATTIELAATSDERRKGLLGRDALAPDTAIVIAPCSAIHTFGMRFSIDALFTDRRGCVLKIARDLRPARIAASLRAFATIEMTAGDFSRHDVRVGDLLKVI